MWSGRGKREREGERRKERGGGGKNEGEEEKRDRLRGRESGGRRRELRRYKRQGTSGLDNNATTVNVAVNVYRNGNGTIDLMWDAYEKRYIYELDYGGKKVYNGSDSFNIRRNHALA